MYVYILPLAVAFIGANLYCMQAEDDSSSPVARLKEAKASNGPESNSQEKFKLIISLYNEKDDARAQEYITCLDRNRIHEAIDAIHVVYDTSDDDDQNRILNYLKEAGIPVTYVQGRPSYGFCFDLAASLYPNSRVIVSNGDIFFNATLKKLQDFDLTGRFLAITRYDIGSNGDMELHQRYRDTSQDVWIFKTPLQPIDQSHELYLGENHHNVILSYEALRSGLEVLNPSKSIQCCHLHASYIRHYDLTIPFPKHGHTMGLHCIRLEEIQ